MTTTYNPSDKSSGASLSNANRTVTWASGGNDGVRSVDTNTANQKVYLEVVYTNFTANSPIQGWANSSWVLSDPLSFGGSAANACASNATAYHDGGSVNDGFTLLTATPGTGDIVSWALNTQTGKIWARINGGIWNNNGANDPATGVGGYACSVTGPLYAAASVRGSGDSYTANFASANWTYSAPSGFTELGASGAVSPTYPQLERGIRGLHRGIATGSYR